MVPTSWIWGSLSVPLILVITVNGNENTWRELKNSRYLLGCLRGSLAIFEGHKKWVDNMIALWMKSRKPVDSSFYWCLHCSKPLQAQCSSSKVWSNVCKKNIYFANQDIYPTAVMRRENCCLIFALKWLFNSMLDLQREKSYKSFIQIALTKKESSWDSYTFISSPILS